MNTTTGRPAVPAGTARVITAAGALATAGSTLLAWTYTSAYPGNLTVYGYPGGLQLLTLASGLITLALALAALGVKGLRWLAPAGTTKALRLSALAGLGTTWFTVVSIAATLGGLVHLEPGAWVAAAASAVPVAGAFLLPDDTRAPAATRELGSWAEILIIVAAFGAGLYVITYGIDTEYGELFTGYLITVGLTAAALSKSGLIARLNALTAKHRTVTVGAAFAAAAAFPFTQTSDQYTSVAANILIFATVALGLNVVVGLAGLLDLGYVAFLGVGAYAAALVSGSPASPFDVHLPFWAAVLVGATASLVFGVVIGAPTLRLRGDYLAIVTLGFGEIFRIAVNNMDGSSGPNITGGPNGVPNIPDLVILGYDFGQPHDIGGITLGRFANYYLLMLVFTAVVVLVFARANNSRIGRAWVAIREDETAATAMGINTFRLKLMAFALGAALAGLAGTVQAHVSYTVVPEQYLFAGPVPPNSAFLLAAVILGGMGTISGPLLGASLLYLIPAKLQFMQDYQLLLFGLALVLLMRFRPEGLIADRRKQLEFHEDTAPPTVPDQKTPDETAGLTKAGA
ncbi:branched-chain amino acid ABC transporter permease [Streptomyces sp. NPDC059506]|uniref:branched-chain amino acid ABC transporter permease n=1 Tax=unclassified Streptomyces TaxID=2593676 RepID=UPI000CB02E7F|nr:branched-chain amino acid ABC transporter permease [Streptomyces sp. SCUT-3]PLW66514.1 branched-chain amino acid ABC transporter permease [Streptomyces sp. DJ]QMV25271.1 branched-chain amino acid ABC transporter permease [Streptomyces sp. SCUT-3]